MNNSQRSNAVREFTREMGCQTIGDGNDLLIRVGGQLYDFQLALPKIKELNKNYAWDSDGDNITGCHLEVFSNMLTEDVVLRINDFFEYVEDEDLTETEDVLGENNNPECIKCGDTETPLHTNHICGNCWGQV